MWCCWGCSYRVVEEDQMEEGWTHKVLLALRSLIPSSRWCHNQGHYEAYKPYGLCIHEYEFLFPTKIILYWEIYVITTLICMKRSLLLKVHLKFISDNGLASISQENTTGSCLELSNIRCSFSLQTGISVKSLLKDELCKRGNMPTFYIKTNC